MSRVKVSVVLTAHNAAATIDRVLGQLRVVCGPEDEVIVVDDGSTDDTGSIIRRNAWEGLVLEAPGRIGRAPALNLGIRKARGTLVAINDADDLSLEGRFELAANEFTARPELGLLVTAGIVAQGLPDWASAPDGPTRSSACDSCPVSATRLFRGNPFHHSTAVFRRETALSVGGYNEDLDVCIDYDFYMRMLAAASMRYIDVPTIVRNMDSRRFFSKYPRLRYIETLREIRAVHRESLHPLPLSKVYDWRLWLALGWERLKARRR